MNSEQLEFRVDNGGHRYTALLAGQEVGFSEVDPIGKEALLIKHTEINPGHEGKGFGGQLVRHMLEDAKRQGRSVIPICPYSAAWIKKHPEYMEYVRPSYRSVLAG
jgi:hypothetical protein